MVIIKYLMLFILIIFSINNILYAVEYNHYNKVKIQILNKITGKSEVVNVKINTIFHFNNNLSLVVKACYKTTQKYDPEDVMFIQIAKSGNSVDPRVGLENNIQILNNANEYVNKFSNLNMVDKSNNQEELSVDLVNSQLIFSGWIFSNLPEISSLIDAVYDISIIKCFN